MTSPSAEFESKSFWIFAYRVLRDLAICRKVPLSFTNSVRLAEGTTTGQETQRSALPRVVYGEVPTEVGAPPPRVSKRLECYSCAINVCKLFLLTIVRHGSVRGTHQCNH